MSSTENPDSVAAARELEALRAEASALRRQLAESPEQLREMESRVDSLSIRNTKLMDTLKEARQQLIALREEVDRLGQPPSGYGVLLGVHDDQTVDVFTSGRKMRLTCSPNVDAETLKLGQTVRLNEALTIVEAGNFERVGEISTLREVLDDGQRALAGIAPGTPISSLWSAARLRRSRRSCARPLICRAVSLLPAATPYPPPTCVSTRLWVESRWHWCSANVFWLQGRKAAALSLTRSATRRRVRWSGKAKSSENPSSTPGR